MTNLIAEGVLRDCTLVIQISNDQFLNRRRAKRLDVGDSDLETLTPVARDPFESPNNLLAEGVVRDCMSRRSDSIFELPMCNLLTHTPPPKRLVIRDLNRQWDISGDLLDHRRFLQIQYSMGPKHCT